MHSTSLLYRCLVQAFFLMRRLWWSVVNTGLLSFEAKKLEVFSQKPLRLFQNTRVLKIWNQIFEKLVVFCRKFVQKVPKKAFFRRASRNLAQFWLIYSKNAENRMSFEIDLVTTTTGLLSFGLKNP